MEKPEESSEQLAVRVSVKTIAVNAALSAFKLFAAIYAHSSAMLSDAVESIADILSTLVVIAGVKLAGRKPDKEHPYGHERFECVAAIILAVMLCAVGVGIGWDGARKVMAGFTGGDLAAPGVLALVAAAVTIVVKEGMYWYKRAAAKKTGSAALMADAWHHRSDALSSIGTFAGILGARLGLPILDPVACLLTCVFILKAAVGIFRDAVGRMTDRACGDEVTAELRDIILTQAEVQGIDELNTRLFGNKIYVDVEISADEAVPLRQAHEIAQRVHDAIEERFPDVKHCMVHVNPAYPKTALVTDCHVTHPTMPSA